MEVAAAPAAPAAAPVAPTGEGNNKQSLNNSSSSSKSDNSSQDSGRNSSGSVEPLDPKSTKAVAKPADELFELTVDGKPVKWTKAQVIAYASKAHVADKKFEEASQLRKEHESIRDMAKKDPMGALAKMLGISEDELQDPIEQFYNKKWIEPETLTPEQRELKRYREQEKQREAEAAEQKQRDEQAAGEKLTAQHREILQKNIISALEASGLPKTPYYASRMAFHMGQNMKRGWDAPQEIIIEAVKSEHNSALAQMASLPPEEIIKVMGNDFVNKIRAYDLKLLRERRGGLANSFSGRTPEPSTENGRPKIDMQEVNERMRRMKQGEW
jgi:hypothetical protein